MKNKKFGANEKQKFIPLEKSYISNFLSKNPNSHLQQIRFFYKRGEFLIAIQYIFQLNIYFNNNDQKTFIFTDPKIFGPENFTLNEIDEIILNFEKNEEIFLIEGNITENKIMKLLIQTNVGKFIMFGNQNLPTNFSKDFFFDKKLFDGFKINYDEEKITYLKILYKIMKEQDEININKNNIDDNKIKLKEDLDFSLTNIIKPIYKSETFGKTTEKTEFIDQIKKFNLLEKIKNNSVFISKISIFTDNDNKKITRFETEYKNLLTNEINNSITISNDFNINENKEFSLKISADDFINNVSLSVKDKKIVTLFFETMNGEKLIIGDKNILNEIINNSYNNYNINNNNNLNNINICFNDNESEGKMFRLLGFVLGKEKSIQSIQIYYEIKILNDS